VRACVRVFTHVCFSHPPGGGRGAFRGEDDRVAARHGGGARDEAGGGRARGEGGVRGAATGDFRCFRGVACRPGKKKK